MTSKRKLALTLGGLALVAATAAVVEAGWFCAGGKWYYTPDIGSSITISALPNTTAQPATAVFSVHATRWGLACLNPANNMASETVVIRDVTVSSVANFTTPVGKKEKGKVTVTTDVNTDNLARNAYCVNPNWNAQADSVLVYDFVGEINVYSCDKDNPTSCTTLQATNLYSCTLRGSYGPLNLPPANTPYDCVQTQ